MQRFPKVELHRHLEGTFPVGRLFELSLKNNLNRPRDFEAFQREVTFPKDSSPDFLAFLSKFHTDWYRSHDDVYFITYHSVRDLVEDGLFYCELRFSPEHFALENDFDREEITRLIVSAGNRAAEETGLNLRYLLTFNRSKQTVEQMLACRRSWASTWRGTRSTTLRRASRRCSRRCAPTACTRPRCTPGR
jgi:adenosine deaminase